MSAREHIAAVQQACAESAHPFTPETDVLSAASCGRLSAALTAATRAGTPVAVLHLLCHGSAAGTTFGLAFDTEDGDGGCAVVDAGRMRQLLEPFAATLRLVVLAACDSGNSGGRGISSGAWRKRCIASASPAGSLPVIRCRPPARSGWQRSSTGRSWLSCRPWRAPFWRRGKS